MRFNATRGTMIQSLQPSGTQADERLSLLWSGIALLSGKGSDGMNHLTVRENG